MFYKAVRAAAVAAVLATSLVGCSDDEVALDPDKLVIGVSGTEPGLAYMKPDGTYSGFEIDLASYVAKRLGWNARQVTFRMVETDRRDEALNSGEVDLVMSSYAITDERAEVIDFAGPYFTAGQDLLIPKRSKVTGPSSLGTKTVCGIAGSDELEAIQQADRAPDAGIRAADTYAECVDLLLAGQVDAVTADDVVLAGFATRHPDQVRVVGSPFTTVSYGVGLREGSTDVAAVDVALRSAIDDGTWEASFERNLGSSGYTAPLPPTPGEAIAAS